MQHTGQALGQVHPVGGKPHPTPTRYAFIAAVLTLVTVVEVAVYYVESMRPLFGYIFPTLSALKFALVAMFYMHLKFDSRLFTSLFVGGLVLAAFLSIALTALAGILTV